MSLLEVSRLTKIYGDEDNKVVALNDISFSVEKGEFIAVMGTSGSGKSTLMHIIGAVDSPTYGSVIVDGIDLHKLSRKELAVYRRRKVALIYQAFNLLPMLNVRDNITLPSELDGKRVDEDELQKMMKDIGIDDKDFNYPNQLSGGQQQRVAIARALIATPAILLADEPTGNLDSKNTAEIMELFRRSNEKLQQTVIVVTHDEQVANAADRIIVIEDGKIASDRKTSQSEGSGEK